MVECEKGYTGINLRVHGRRQGQVEDTVVIADIVTLVLVDSLKHATVDVTLVLQHHSCLSMFFVTTRATKQQMHLALVAGI